MNRAYTFVYRLVHCVETVLSSQAPSDRTESEGHPGVGQSSRLTSVVHTTLGQGRPPWSQAWNMIAVWLISQMAPGFVWLCLGLEQSLVPVRSVCSVAAASSNATLHLLLPIRMFLFCLLTLTP